MSKFDYAKSAAKAAALIERFGVAITAERRTSSGIDIATGQALATASETFAYNGVMFDKSSMSLVSSFGIAPDSDLVVRSDRVLLMDAVGRREPKIDDVYTLQDGRYACVGYTMIRPATIAVMYIVGVAKQ